MTGPDLEVLVTRAVAGESGAFEALVEQHHAQVYRWALVAAEDPDEADDLVQQVWIKVHRSLGQYRRESRFTTWLYRIVANTAVEGHRTRSRRAAALATMSQGGEEPTVQMRETIDAGRLAAMVRGYLLNLPLRQRMVFALADLEGISSAEIAERLEMAEVTVRTNLFKARRAIRERLLREQPRLVEEFRS